jgi:hypothetical protein
MGLSLGANAISGDGVVGIKYLWNGGSFQHFS